jgi:hypothetical protein
MEIQRSARIHTSGFRSLDLKTRDFDSETKSKMGITITRETNKLESESVEIPHSPETAI